MSALSQSGQFGDSRDNPRVRTASAKIAAHGFAYRSPIGRIVGQNGNSRQDLSRCAIPALQRIVTNEGVLQRMKAIKGSKTFNGRDVTPFVRRGERQTRNNTATVNDHRARPHAPRSQPCFVPVIDNSIRRTSSNVDVASTNASVGRPLTVNVRATQIRDEIESVVTRPF